MIKKELIENVSVVTGMRKKDVSEIVNAVTSEIIKAVASGDSVRLVGFGTFAPSVVKARAGKLNFGSGGTWETPEHSVPKFKAGKEFKDAVAK